MKKIKGMTSTGFSFEIDEEARDDMEILERLIDMSRGDLTAMPDVLLGLLGTEQKKAFNAPFSALMQMKTLRLKPQFFIYVSIWKITAKPKLCCSVH